MCRSPRTSLMTSAGKKKSIKFWNNHNSVSFCCKACLMGYLSDTLKFRFGFRFQRSSAAKYRNRIAIFFSNSYCVHDSFNFSSDIESRIIELIAWNSLDPCLQSRLLDNTRGCFSLCDKLSLRCLGRGWNTCPLYFGSLSGKSILNELVCDVIRIDMFFFSSRKYLLIVITYTSPPNHFFHFSNSLWFYLGTSITHRRDLTHCGQAFPSNANNQASPTWWCLRWCSGLFPTIIIATVTY